MCETVDLYQEFLAGKIKIAERVGIKIDPSELHPSLRPDQKDITVWGLDLGRGLVAPDAGMGKTRIGIEVMRILQSRFGGMCLIVTELGAADTFIDKDPEVGEGVNLGLDLRYVTSQEEAEYNSINGRPISVTNYERVRDGNFDFGAFTAVWLDEGNYIKNMASETTEVLKQQLAKVKYKYIATATPSPNEDLELVNYAHVLGVCDRGQILTQFFQRNSTKAGDLTLHAHHAADFWLWVSSWCVAITSPRDLGYEYEGFDLPRLNIHWVEIPNGKHRDVKPERDGQGLLFKKKRQGFDSFQIIRDSIDARIEKTVEIVNSRPDEHFIFWHQLEDERFALNKVFKSDSAYGDIFGKMPEDLREKRVVQFTKGELGKLATKYELNGVGCNFQKHCFNAIFFSFSDSFNDLYQALKRVYRFYQKHDCNAWFFYTPEEYDKVNNIKRKWDEHNRMRFEMNKIIRRFGLNVVKIVEERKRTFHMERKEYGGKGWKVINNDCVHEWKTVDSHSVKLINSSFPFGNHYEYTNKYNDFGHNSTNQDFKLQLDFLLPELFRSLEPGRICAVHLKNRIHYGSVTGLGFSTFHRFTHLVCGAMEEHGFQTMGFHYINTDVVAENNQTYRLGYGEMQKDATKMGAGIPEEYWIFRKPPSSSVNSYADAPVLHNMLTCPYCHHVDVFSEFSRDNAIICDCPSCKQFMPFKELLGSDELIYSLAKWQVDADGFYRSSGNRYLTPEELAGMSLKQIRRWWNKFNSQEIYDFEQHVEFLERLESKGMLSREFVTLPLRSNTPYIWNDVNRMHGLNSQQRLNGQQNHICPQPFDEPRRVIHLYSNKGDLVADCFGGIGTTGIEAIKQGRETFLVELNDLYAKCAAGYLAETVRKQSLPTLFDLLTDVEPKHKTA